MIHSTLIESARLSACVQTRCVMNGSVVVISAFRDPPATACVECELTVEQRSTRKRTHSKPPDPAGTKSHKSFYNHVGGKKKKKVLQSLTTDKEICFGQPLIVCAYVVSFNIISHRTVLEVFLSQISVICVYRDSKKGLWHFFSIRFVCFFKVLALTTHKNINIKTLTTTTATTETVTKGTKLLIAIRECPTVLEPE